MTPCEEMDLQLHGLIDGELDAMHAARVEAHLASCPDCAKKYKQLRALRTAVRAGGVAEPAPAALKERLARLAGASAAANVTGLFGRRSARPAPGWFFAAGAFAALAASLALFALVLPAAPSLQQELVEGHIRSLQAQHLVDMPTSDRHVVKPWFAGKIDFAPPAVDLAAQGFPLVGGRLDYLGHRPVAALVFRRGPHLINLFIWPGAAPAGPRLSHQQGYGLLRWGHGGLVFWAVSDCDPAALAGFQKAFAERTA